MAIATPGSETSRKARTLLKGACMATLVAAACATAGAFVVESTLLFLIARRRLGLHMFVWRPRHA